MIPNEIIHKYLVKDRNVDMSYFGEDRYPGHKVTYDTPTYTVKVGVDPQKIYIIEYKEKRG